MPFADTLDVLQERVPLLRSPGGLAIASLAPLLLLGLGVWGVVSLLGAAPAWGLGLAVGLLALRAGIERAAEELEDGLVLGLVGLVVEGVYLLSILGAGGDLLPGWLAWPVAAYLTVTGGLLFARSWVAPTFLGGPARGLARGGPHELLRHPCLGGLARVALGLGVAGGGALGLLLGLIYLLTLLSGRARRDDLARLEQEGSERCGLPALFPESLGAEARLLVVLLEPAAPVAEE
ncbi:MAG: hypothetical protein JXX28_14970 [Deltaproteobacteria bacterium]|nr:hypothetical protein [Deltaproteobacteria bacterium]